MARAHLLPTGLALLLLGLHLVLSVRSLQTTAPTFDEVAHLPAGLAQLQGGHHLNPEHPPLAKLVAAVPLLFQDIHLDQDIPGWRAMDEWQFGRALLFDGGRDGQQLITLGRLTMMGFGVLLCLVVWLWSRRLYGPWAALLSLGLCALSPTLMAHARLVTTDVPVAAFGVLAAFLCARLVEKPGWKRAVAFGLALGVAMAVKFSGVLWIPALSVALLVVVWRHGSGEDMGGAQLARASGLLLLALGTACGVVFLSYGPPWSPSAYLEGIATIGFNHRANYAFYLMDSFSAGGFTLYFPTAFLIKSSPALLLVLILAGLQRLRRGRTGMEAPKPLGIDGWFLLFPALIYGGFVWLKAPEIGIRYLIPIYPFLFIWAGGVAAVLLNQARGWIALIILLALQIQTALVAQPDPISYFNGLLDCSGPTAIQCLDDSNLDWGQDLARLEAALRPFRRPGEEVALLYFGTANPSAYLDNWRRMGEEELLRPAPQLYAVSLHRLNRLGNFLGKPNGVDWLQQYRPVARVGNTYHIYDFRTRAASRDLD